MVEVEVEEGEDAGKKRRSNLIRDSKDDEIEIDHEQAWRAR